MKNKVTLLLLIAAFAAVFSAFRETSSQSAYAETYLSGFASFKHTQESLIRTVSAADLASPTGREEVRAAIPNSTVFTHLEPLEDPVSFEDVRLERLRGEEQRRSEGMA